MLHVVNGPHMYIPSQINVSMVFLHIVSDFELVEMDSDDSSGKLSEAAWLDRWSQLISFIPHISKVPPHARNITTPLVLSGWCQSSRPAPSPTVFEEYFRRM